VTGYMFPTLAFVGRYVLENNVTGLNVGNKYQVRVTVAQGYKLKRMLKGEHWIQMYLMAGEELKIVREENTAENALVHILHEEVNQSHSEAIMPSAPGGEECGVKHPWAGGSGPRPGLLQSRQVSPMSRPVSPMSRPVSPMSRQNTPPPRPLSPPTRHPHSVSYSSTSMYPLIE